MDVFARAPEFPVPYTPKYGITSSTTSGLPPPKILPTHKSPSEQTVKLEQPVSQVSHLPPPSRVSEEGDYSVGSHNSTSEDYARSVSSTHAPEPSPRLGSNTPPTPPRKSPSTTISGTRSSLPSTTGIKAPSIQPVGFSVQPNQSSLERTDYVHHTDSSKPSHPISHQTGILPPSQIKPPTGTIYSESLASSNSTSKSESNFVSGIKPPSGLVRPDAYPASGIPSAHEPAIPRSDKNGFTQDSKISASVEESRTTMTIHSGIKPPSRVPRTNQA